MMETNFELKNVTFHSNKEDNVVKNNYDLNFDVDGKIKTISMSGIGKIKESIKV